MFNFISVRPFKSGITNIRWVCKPCHQFTEKTTCVLMPGDGVGPELIASIQNLFEAHSIPVDLLTYTVSKKDKSTFYEALEAIVKHGVCLKTPFDYYEPTTTGDYENYNVRLRTLLDIYGNVVRIRALPNIDVKRKDIDLVIIREQTEALYRGLEHESVKGLIECLDVVTRQRSWRIAKFAFDYATKFGRKTVTCVHKADIMKLSDGMFLKCCRDMSRLYPHIKFNEMIVDNCIMKLVSTPSVFDVIVTPNLYGHLVDNVGVGMVGGAGVVPGASFGDRCVIYEPAAQHSFHKGAGKNIANPTAMLLCAANMLRHVSRREEAEALKCAVRSVLQKGKVRTPDLGGTASTTDFTKAVIEHMHQVKSGDKTKE